MIDPHLNFLTEKEKEEGGILIILVGPPKCGKTDLAVEICDNLKNTVVISPSVIRTELTGNPYDFTRNVEVFNKLFSRANLFLGESYNVIYDATNCRIQNRRKIINATKETAKKHVCILFNVSLSECIEENKHQCNAIPDEAIEKMYLCLKKHNPTITEGFDIIVSSNYE